jgi:hypothetical protein
MNILYIHSLTTALFYFINLIRCGTPLVNRLRKRKTTASSVKDKEDNPKSTKSDGSGDTGSSMTSKKRRRV